MQPLGLGGVAGGAPDVVAGEEELVADVAGYVAVGAGDEDEGVGGDDGVLAMELEGWGHYVGDFGGVEVRGRGKEGMQVEKLKW